MRALGSKQKIWQVVIGGDLIVRDGGLGNHIVVEINLWQVCLCDGEDSPMAWQSSRDSWTIGIWWRKVFLVYRLGHRMELYRGFHCRKKFS